MVDPLRQLDLFGVPPDVPQNLGAPPPYIRDHRKRLRHRLREAGVDALADYELLELVLFRAINRQDVKPLARRLLDVFGDFNAVISAPRAQLANIKGVGDSVIDELKIVEATAHRLAQSRLSKGPLINSWPLLLDYCQTTMAHRKTEQFRVLFMDRKNHLIRDEVLSEGTIDQTAVFPREIVKRALDLEASALILLHNHPSGDPAPSIADVEMTQEVITAAASLSITVHDHLIIGQDGHVSFREQGLL
ncbi:MAG: RadC family protein [Planktomarina sp.]